jgi:transposase
MPATPKKGRPIQLHGSLARRPDHQVHAVVDANGRPIGLALSEGQAYDGHSAQALLDSLAPGSILLADRAYDADKLRQAIASKGAFANIPPMPQRTRRPAFSPFLYQPHRALLQQTQTLQSHRNARRQKRRQLPRLNPARLNPHLVAI